MRRASRRFAAAWVSLAVLAASSASGEGQLGGGGGERTERSRPVVLEGLVVAIDGAPVEGAVVVSGAGGQAVTDRGGRYRLEVEVPLDVRSLEITAAHSGDGNLLASAKVELGAEVQAVRVAPLELAAGTCVPNWLPTFGGQPGVDGEVFALAVFDDGTGPALYVGGAFQLAGGIVANNVAKWDGSEWSDLGGGVQKGSGVVYPVFALAVFDDGSGPSLYVGGAFQTAGGVPVSLIAKWDGSAWSAVGSGLGIGGGEVSALAVFDDGSGPSLYAGGSGVPSSIAKWDGSSWTALGSGLAGEVNALTVFDDGGGPALYAGGRFTTAGGLPANRLAKWNGSTWSPLGSGVSGTPTPEVFALAVFDDGGGPALFVGGSFLNAGGVAATRIAKWDGSTWSPLGSGTNSPVLSLSVFDDGGGPTLYAGGEFSSAGGVSVNNIAKWDGSSWSPLGSGVGPVSQTSVEALTVFDDGSGPALIAGGGALRSAGGIGVNNIASWKDSTWSTLGRGLNDSVRALAVFDDGGGAALYAAGEFTGVGGGAASRIARWDGSSWSPLGSGLDDTVLALTVFDDGGGAGLYAAGEFTTAGGVAASRIARWDGSSWSALGSGMSGGLGGSTSIEALTVFDDGAGPALYAGGDFLFAGGVPVDHVAKWNGAAWSEVGDPYSLVHALAVFDDGGGAALYAGLGGGAYPVSRWTGSDWLPLGGWTSGGEVDGLAVFDDGSGPALYAGGSFSTAGIVPASNIARWDGLAWSSLGSGTNGSVGELAVFDDGGGPALYAGGSFTTAGGIGARALARWDGLTWSPLGIGTYSAVTALAVFDRGGPSLYVGSTAFAKGDSFLGRWGCIDTTPPTLSCPPVVIELDNLGTASGETVSFTVTAEDDLDPSPDVVCMPPSGSFFPRGTTMVTCTATDASGNESTCEFPVTVQIKARKL